MGDANERPHFQASFGQTGAGNAAIHGSVTASEVTAKFRQMIGVLLWIGLPRAGLVY